MLRYLEAQQLELHAKNAELHFSIDVPADASNLTVQIADAIRDVIQPAGVAVTIEAEHLCMKMRGVEKQNSSMTTSMMLGTFLDHDRTRSEFLRLVRS